MNEDVRTFSLFRLRRWGIQIKVILGQDASLENWETYTPTNILKIVAMGGLEPPTPAL